MFAHVTSLELNLYAFDGVMFAQNVVCKFVVVCICHGSTRVSYIYVFCLGLCEFPSQFSAILSGSLVGAGRPIWGYVVDVIS